MIKISVVVPVYNTERYLRRCLDSILNQTLREIEVIIVNDESPDNSHKIIEEYKLKDSRIKVINKKNGGISSARNTGIEYANGKYIIHIDSDDWIEQNYFKDMFFRAKKDDLDIVVSDFWLDYDNGETEYRNDLKILDKEIIDAKKYSDIFFKGEIYTAIWNKMYKTKLYKENKIFYPQGMSLGEDLLVNILLALKSKKIGKINKAYLHYIQNISSTTKYNPTKKIYELISIFKLLAEKVQLENYNQLDINTTEIMHLNKLIFDRNYDFKDKFYKLAFEYYCSLLKKEFKFNRYSKKTKLYLRLVHLLPHPLILKFILNFDRILFKIKEKIRNITKRRKYR